MFTTGAWCNGNIPVLGTGDSGFESRRSDIKQMQSEKCKMQN